MDRGEINKKNLGRDYIIPKITQDYTDYEICKIMGDYRRLWEIIEDYGRLYKIRGYYRRLGEIIIPQFFPDILKPRLSIPDKQWVHTSLIVVLIEPQFG